VIRALKALRAAAQKMLDSGRLSAQQQQEALQQIISLNQQIKDAATNAVQTFTVPARLALNLARDTALGRSTTKDLLAIRKAILRFIATHRHNLAALTDAYNQLADINQQLGSSAQSALGSFKQASTRALTAGLGLTQNNGRHCGRGCRSSVPAGQCPAKASAPQGSSSAQTDARSRFVDADRRSPGGTVRRSAPPGSTVSCASSSGSPTGRNA
jgi:ribosomal protein S25